MLRYIFSLLVFCFFNVGFSQKKVAATVKTDTIKQRYGFRFGADLYTLSKSVYDKNYKGFELVADYRLTKRFYIAAELGNENITTITDNFNYNNKGSYIKAGFDFNAYENWLNMENMVYTGMRVGVSNYSQTINTYNIYQPPTYYGLDTKQSNDKTDGLSAVWLEVVAGVKAKVYNNIFIGFSVRVNYLANNNKPLIEDTFYIPGFNSVTENNKFGAGFNYTVSYLIPLYKRKTNTEKPKVEEKTNKKL
jgi:hypothetical protein